MRRREKADAGRSVRGMQGAGGEGVKPEIGPVPMPAIIDRFNQPGTIKWIADALGADSCYPVPKNCSSLYGWRPGVPPAGHDTFKEKE